MEEGGCEEKPSLYTQREGKMSNKTFRKVLRKRRDNQKNAKVFI